MEVRPLVCKQEPIKARRATSEQEINPAPPRERGRDACIQASSERAPTPRRAERVPCSRLSKAAETCPMINDGGQVRRRWLNLPTPKQEEDAGPNLSVTGGQQPGMSGPPPRVAAALRSSLRMKTSEPMGEPSSRTPASGARVMAGGKSRRRYLR